MVLGWHASDGERLPMLPKQATDVLAIAFSPDSAVLATAGTDGVVRLEVAVGTEIRSLFGHDGPVAAVAFSPDDFI